MNEKLITIGTAARILGLSSEAVRGYERRGIIAPQRDSQGRRLLSTKDILMIQKIIEKRLNQQAQRGFKSDK